MTNPKIYSHNITNPIAKHYFLVENIFILGRKMYIFDVNIYIFDVNIVF